MNAIHLSVSPVNAQKTSLTHQRPQLIAITDSHSIYDPQLVTFDSCIHDSRNNFPRPHWRRLLEGKLAAFTHHNLTIHFNDPILRLPDLGQVIIQNSDYEYVVTVTMDLMIKILFELLAFKTDINIIYIHKSGLTINGLVHVTGKSISFVELRLALYVVKFFHTLNAFTKSYSIYFSYCHYFSIFDFFVLPLHFRIYLFVYLNFLSDVHCL